jgi:MFS-type transporter involved in bile tolerance (Atg22 family)
MTSDPDPKQERPESHNKDESTMRLIWSMADTTWRMFTPPALVVPLGLWADLKFHTKPWLTLVSAIVGLVLSALLVKKQLGDSQ